MNMTKRRNFVKSGFAVGGLLRWKDSQDFERKRVGKDLIFQNPNRIPEIFRIFRIFRIPYSEFAIWKFFWILEIQACLIQ
jgi:hypothetical protein